MTELQTFGVSLPIEDIKALDRIARGKSVSRAVIVRWAVTEYLTKLASKDKQREQTDTAIAEEIRPR